jgi:uncharacterized membrane protein YdfJ with MMPL/SSD domain
MPPQSDLLIAIAQISIAFAGFSGVIASFSKFRLHADVTRFRVQLIVVAGLSTVIFSLLPFLPALFGVDEELGWRLCCAVLFVVGVVFPYFAVKRARELYRAGLLHTQAFTIVYNLIGVAITAALFFSAAGPLSHLGAAVYITSLVFTLFLCAYYFFMQMFAIDLDAKP